MQDPSALEMLPVMKLQAKRTGTEEMVEVLVDGDYDGQYFAEYDWRVMPSGYVMRYNTRDLEVDKTGKAVQRKQAPMYLHGLVLPKRKGFWVTHINGNKLDNRSANLRYETPSDIAKRRNETHKDSYAPGRRQPRRPKRSPYASKYIGVQRERYNYGGVVVLTGMYTVMFRGKYIGRYPSEDAAGRVYDKHARKHYGDSVALNFPDS